MAKIPIGQKAVGDLIKLNVNGFPKKFVVIHQGNPDASVYDSSCDGTWVLMQDAYNYMKLETDSDYSVSNIHSYLNDDFLDLLDTDVKNAIKQVKIPYTYGSGTGAILKTGADGLSTKIFTLSVAEVNGNGSSWTYTEGATLQYFAVEDSTALKEKRIAYGYDYLNRYMKQDWLLRTLTYSTTTYWYFVDDDGGVHSAYAGQRYNRPAFILPYDFEVSAAISINGYSNIGGTNKELTGEGYVNIGGTLKPLAESYINIGGTLKSLS